MREYIFFDLDGTLTESAPGITKSARYALRHYGIEADLKELLCFVGPPLSACFEAYGLKGERVKEAIGKYREYYIGQDGIFDNALYNGVAPMIERLWARGARLVLATSKQESSARVILGHFGIDGFFDAICGGDLEQGRVEKGDVIRHALKLTGISPESAVMVGDRKHDVIGAKAHGMRSVGVLYGYGSRDELEEAGADHIVATVAELEALLLTL